MRFDEFWHKESWELIGGPRDPRVKELLKKVLAVIVFLVFAVIVACGLSMGFLPGSDHPTYG